MIHSFFAAHLPLAEVFVAIVVVPAEVRLVPLDETAFANRAVMRTCEL